MKFTLHFKPLLLRRPITEALKEIRARSGLNQAEFAKKLDTAQAIVSKLEHGHRPLQPQFIGRIIAKLELSFEDSLTWELLTYACPDGVLDPKRLGLKVSISPRTSEDQDEKS